MTRQIDIPVSASGLLAEFAQAGLLGWSGVHLANTLGWLGDERDPQVLLAIALCLGAQESGSVCLPLDDAGQGLLLVEPDEDVDRANPADLPWPDPDEWLATLSDSPLVGLGEQAPANQRPLRVVGRKLYLERNWQAEEQVRQTLLHRQLLAPPELPGTALDDAIDRAFAGFSSAPAATARQRAAVRTSATSWTSVIAGGPGTGKTTTIAQLLRVLDDLADRPTGVALASFTGKAAARMQHSLDASLAATGGEGHDWQHLQVGTAATLHRLLGSRRDWGFSHDASNPLPHDVVIVDEMSMVSLQMMVHLLAALRPGTRLVMVGDPDQLSSVDAGAVLADIVTAGLPVSAGASDSAITVLDHSHRFSGPIQQFAEAIRTGQPEAALAVLGSGAPEVEWIETDADPGSLPAIAGLATDLVDQGRQMRQAALAADAPAALVALDSHRLLCAHRRGRYGVSSWSRAVDRLLRSHIAGFAAEGEWYPGRPVLITRNRPDLDISNGDTGVAISVGDQVEVALTAGDLPRMRSPWVLDSAETMHALTVHKSQGSEYDRVSVVLPVESPLLTRELFYTAVTRAREQVRIIGTAQAITTAISTPARRATGLGERLRPAV
ncbi:MAG: exodeoxyribonuclease V subunit alpha [Brooklawnia sp.]|jgi:exodeoxyribonuclease V alpha subunit